MEPPNDTSQFRDQLRRLLDSPEFLGSHRLSKFLAYISEESFAGRDSLEQWEIAKAVFDNKDFNPLDDASVRKLATLTRQKLDKYYGGGGKDDPVQVSLPSRCYVPRYRIRMQPPPEPSSVVAAIPSGVLKRRLRVIVPIVLGCVAVLVAAAVLLPKKINPRPEPATRFEILTVPGDVMHGVLAAAPNAIQLGPAVGPYDDVTVRMEFTAEAPNQQAGIMIFENPDRYIKLGRHFTTRTQLEFGLETGGRYRKNADTFAYDFSGQSGAPIWLSIRRQDNRFRAFVSSDGILWRGLGEPLELSDPIPHARAAIFAFNGETDAPRAKAIFSHFSVGVNFHEMPNTSEFLSGISAWTNLNTCLPDGQLVRLPDRIAFDMPHVRRLCGWYFSRPVPAGDWSFVTLLDFLSSSGTYAGLRLTGKRDGIRIIRWTLDSPVLMWEQRGAQIRRRDFPGSPPVYLRVDLKRGRVTAGFSRDGDHFESFPISVPVSDLGPELRVSLSAGRSSWSGAGDLPPAYFFYIRREASTLVPYR